MFNKKLTANEFSFVSISLEIDKIAKSIKSIAGIYLLLNGYLQERVTVACTVKLAQEIIIGLFLEVVVPHAVYQQSNSTQNYKSRLDFKQTS